GRDYANARGANVSLRLPGQIADPLWSDSGFEESIDYNVNRWHKPEWGQYLSADPIGLAGGTNLLAYAEANPIVNSDPLGEKVCRCTRRLATSWPWGRNRLAHHAFVEIVRDSQPCGEGLGMAWGF